MVVILQQLSFGLAAFFVVAAAILPCAAAGNRTLSVSVARRDLRPLGGVSLQLAGAVTVQGVTDENGRIAFLGLPAAGAITVTPTRSGFGFEPPQLAIADLGNVPIAAFAAFPTSTDLALSIVTDNETPLVGGLVNGVITLRNLGTEAATDIAVGIGSLPGLVLENRQATLGRLSARAYDTVWTLAQLDPGASAEVHYRSRATLPEANVLAVALVEEMDQTDINPLNNSAQVIARTRTAQAGLSLAMTIDPATAKVGETLPVRLTVRNDGPQDATQIAVRSYTPPGASFLSALEPGQFAGSFVIPRLMPGAEVQLTGEIRVRFAGESTLIANVTSFEQELPAGATWPEARATYTVQQAFSHLTLLAFTDPPNPRVGDDVHINYVVRNDGPDTVTGLKLFIKPDSRLDLPRFSDPNPPVPPVEGPFVSGDILPAGAYTYVRYRYSVTAAGDLTNYFTVEYQDQLIPNVADHPELYVPIKTVSADVGLSLDADPKEITAQSGEPVTIEFQVHNDGPQPARGVYVDYSSFGLGLAELDEVIHADRVLRPGGFGYIDVVDPGETVRVRKHFIASSPGSYTNAAEITTSHERPDLLLPIAWEWIRLNVLPGPPPDLGISVNVDKPQVNVGEYAIFIVTVTNRAAQPAFNVVVREPDNLDTDFALETVRSYGPGGDDRGGSAWQRTIPEIDPGATYSMSRTMRLRKPVTVPYFAKIEGANGLLETEIPVWRATTEVTGVQVTSDLAPIVIPDRTNVKNGDLVNFAIIAQNVSSRVGSHIAFAAAESTGFQVLGAELGNYGYYWDYARPGEMGSGWKPYSEWTEIRPREHVFSWTSMYTVGAGELAVGAGLSQLDQLDGQETNDVVIATIHSAPASASVSLRQTVFPENPRVGYVALFVTEIRNEGPDRVTGLTLAESSSTNLELTTSPPLNGVSGDVATSIWDSLVRLPSLEPGQNFVWQRSYIARSPGNAWHRVRVDRFDQTALAPLPESTAELSVQPAQADLELEFLDLPPTVAQDNIPTLVSVRVRNLGPGVATGVKVAVNVPEDALNLGTFGYGPRATYVLFEPHVFQTALLPGESAIAGFYVTPRRVGAATSFVQVQHLDQTDPNTANNTLSWTLNAGAEPAIPSIMRIRKVRTDFFDKTPITEVEIDQAALNRFAPFSTFYLDRSSNLRDWEYLRLVGFTPLAPVTFTDHSEPGVTMQAYRLRR